MRRIAIILSVLVALVSWTKLSWAADNVANNVVISEIQTGSATDAGQEFIELYNPTSAPIDLSGWHIQYHPASSSSSWTNRTPNGLAGSIPADGFYLVSPTDYLNGDASLSAGMAQTGGTVQLTDQSGSTVDLVGWGTAVVSEGSPASAAAAGQSLERLPGKLNETGGNGIDTASNSADFVIRDTPQPQSTVSATEGPGAVGTDPDSGPDSTPSYVPVVINELLVDPASPQSDSHDEFIELYNPTDQTAKLAGYQLKTGSNFHDHYTLPDVTLAPNGYAVFTSAQTKLALTNTGGAAELLDPDGNVIDQTADYDQADSGLSFSRFDDGWDWTTRVTPGSANIMAAPAEDSATAKSASAKKTSAKKASSKASKSSSKLKSSKTSKSKTSGSPLVAAVTTGGLTGRWLIIGLATLTIGYAIYEFRFDLYNYYIITRRKLQARRADRKAANGR